MNARTARFPLLDSMRALAAISVLCSHAAFSAGAVGPGASSIVRHLASRLDVGVALFFLISGFLLYRPFVAARLDAERPPNWRAYAWRRFLRIVPAYWLALTVIAIVLDVPGVLSAHGFVTYYAFGQIYSSSTIAGGIGQAWTLCIEVTFYALLPVWAAVAHRALRGRSRDDQVRRELLVLAAVFAASLLYKAALIAGQDAVVTGRPLLLALPAYMDHFALGMGLAVLTCAWERGRPVPRLVQLVERAPSIAWAGAAVAYLAVAYGIGLTGAFFEPETPAQFLAHHELYALVGLCALAPAIVGDPARGLLRRALAARPLLWLGLVSYGVYLWHQAVIAKLTDWGLTDVGGIHPYLLWPAAALAGAALCAAASYYVLERPALRLKRLVATPQAPPREALTEPAPALPAAPASRS
jgi:peptidoglycan/LPS O-acetylase OafA/YrhL